MNIDKTLFLMWAIWYIYTFCRPSIIKHMLLNVYCFLNNTLLNVYCFLNNTINNFNIVISPDFWDNNSDISSEENSQEKISNIVEITLPKFEDKYLDDIRKLNKEWIFTDEELKIKMSIVKDLYDGLVDNINNRITEIENQIISFEKEILEDTDVINFIETSDDDDADEQFINGTTIEERNEYRRKQIKKLQEEYNQLKTNISSYDGIEDIKSNADKQANEYIINKRIEKQKNCYIMENTPQGNVLMIYDIKKGSFAYYSDKNIPYRYLEVVARKYVKFFGCRPLFIDMEEELKLCEEKWSKDYELKKAKELEEKLKVEEGIKNNKPVDVKKNVFAKFKSYNKNAGGNISMIAPPKNSIPNKQTAETKEDEKIILKERANRYTYEGKFANFNFLQKIERKVFNKKLGLSFSDFKKIQKN
jgi:hypothetical protein